MKQLWLGLLATLIALPIPCQARPNQEGAYEVLGVGTISCEVWTKDRADKSNDRNFINGAWIHSAAGFLMKSPRGPPIPSQQLRRVVQRTTAALTLRPRIISRHEGRFRIGMNCCRQPKVRLLSPGSFHWLPQSANC
jgi:hypothetical protein